MPGGFGSIDYGNYDPLPDYSGIDLGGGASDGSGPLASSSGVPWYLQLLNGAGKAFVVYQQGQNINDLNKQRLSLGYPPLTPSQYTAGYGLSGGNILGSLTPYVPLLILLFIGAFLLKAFR